MKEPPQQTYFYNDGYNDRPSDGNPLKITQQQYYRAVRLLENGGFYLSMQSNPNGDNFKEREFLFEDCLIRLNRMSQLREGRDTKEIRVFSEQNYYLEKLAESLDLPLPQ